MGGQSKERQRVLSPHTGGEVVRMGMDADNEGEKLKFTGSRRRVDY